ncbi:amidoligase family protein [Ancylobacter oerskovii]|uniref:Amidoligase family protein n=1 Tax=Ancylobacter oerskovii TaxID=459519 RepID=A0ABW4YYD4_9HYPH|nr:amidoligase family protein [Ancylobacter oerskovii]MBS7541833.1 amidoligase family protein [Ancylobacter oerskovii]
MPVSTSQVSSIAHNASQTSSRRVGVEIEFVDLSVRDAAFALERRFGGQLVEEDPQAFHLIGSRLGAMRVELDVRHVHPGRGAGNPLAGLPRRLTTALGSLLAPFVPREIIIGPLERSELDGVDEVVATLRAAGASGDGTTLLDSLGLHFNIAQPSEDEREIVATFKAFLTLEPELRRANGEGVLTRLHAPPPYPPAYVRRVLAPDYWPDLETFRHDYLAANPTRKRSLDLLPLLLHFHAGTSLPRFAGKVRPRPAFHYRLPLARVGRPGWTIAADWERWTEVERLAAEIAAAAPRREAGPGPR